jgi:peptide/nickel transport system permease protein
VTAVTLREIVQESSTVHKWTRLRRRYLLAGIGGIIVLLWSSVIVAAPFIVPSPPNAVNLTLQLLPPTAHHLFGTDQLGRDVFSRVLMGTRVSLPTGFVVVVVGGSFGILYGGIAAYTGAKVDEGMMRVTDLFFCFPPLILAMAIAAALGIGWTNTILAMVIVWWPKYARVSRSLVLVQRSQEYVEAARALGNRPRRILLRHVLPNALGPLVTLLTLDIGNAIITFAGLTFLGLGIRPPTPEWGAMVSEGRVLIEQWWVSTFPGLAIFTAAMGFNFLGDGIRDWLDPRAKRQ